MPEPQQIQELLQEIEGGDILHAPSEETIIDLETAKGAPITVKNLFDHHDAHPIALYILTSIKFGADWVNWPAKVVFSEIQRVFRRTVSRNNREKLNAIRVLHSTKDFWQEWEVFSAITQALNNNIVSFNVLTRPTIAQMMNAVEQAGSIKKTEYASEVVDFIAAVFIDEPVFYAPEPLDFVQRRIVEAVAKVKCGDCGAKFEPHGIVEGRCPMCTGAFRDEKPLNFKPDKDAPDNVGRNLTLEMPYPVETIKDKYETVSKQASNEAVLAPDKIEDIQSAKLLIARDYVNLRRAQLNRQVRLIREAHIA